MKKLHLIANSHIDPIWQWDWEEGVGAAISTFRAVATLAEKHDFIFCHNESYLYEHIEKYEPELFEKIKELVKRGKWKIMGGWFVQPDCLMPSGESIFRQIETGRNYFKEKFGVEPTCAVNLDPFGHSRGIVQVLTKCGYNSYLIKRPEENIFHIDNDLFYWVGFDKSRLKVYRVERYGTLMGHAKKYIDYMSAYETRNEIYPVMIGLGNHGGGLSEKDLSDVENYDREGVSVEYSYPEKFFSKVEPKAVVESSLNRVFPGCYSSLYEIKRKHIELENSLFITEGISVLANLTLGKEYETEKIEKAEKDLLLNEFHDVLAGTVTKSTEKTVIRRFEHGLNELNETFSDALFALLKDEQKAEDGTYPIFVYNPTPFDRNCVIETEFTLCPSNDGVNESSIVKVYDENGILLASQTVKEESNLNWDCRKRVAFQCDLKAFSLNRFYAVSEKTDSNFDRLNSFYKSFCAYAVKGKNFSVSVDKENGKLNEYKVGGENYLSSCGIALTESDDNSDPWGMSEKQRSGIGENERYFRLSDNPSGVYKDMRPVQSIEDGEVYTAIESFFAAENSLARVKYTLYKNQPYFDIDVELIFFDAEKTIRLEIPVEFVGRYIGQTAFGREYLRMDGGECVSHRYVALKREDGKCLAVFNNCVYGSKYQNGKIGVTLVRGIAHCTHPIDDRKLLPSGRFVNRGDIGERTFSFRIAVCEEKELDRLSDEFNKKPYSLNYFPCGKGVSSRTPLIKISDEKVALSSVRKRKDKFIARVFNTSEETVKTDITVNGVGHAVTFEPCEIKTLELKGNEIEFLKF